MSAHISTHMSTHMHFSTNVDTNVDTHVATRRHDFHQIGLVSAGDSPAHETGNCMRPACACNCMRLYACGRPVHATACGYTHVAGPCMRWAVHTFTWHVLTCLCICPSVPRRRPGQTSVRPVPVPPGRAYTHASTNACASMSICA